MPTLELTESAPHVVLDCGEFAPPEWPDCGNFSIVRTSRVFPLREFFAFICVERLSSMPPHPTRGETCESLEFSHLLPVALIPR